MTAPDAARLDRLFHALADPRRRAMLARLASGPATMTDLAALGDVALPSVLKHLQVLEGSGLVSSRKSGRVRTFAMDEEGLLTISAWLDAHKRALGQGFDRLEAAMRATPEETNR